MPRSSCAMHCITSAIASLPFGSRSDFDETDLSLARMMKVAETRKGRAACVLRHHPWRWEPVGQAMQLGWPRLGGARAVGLTQFAGL